MRRPRLAPLVLSLLATGCGGEDTRPVEWSYIHAAIIVPSCATASCHSTRAQLGDVDLQDKQRACDTARGSLDGGGLLRGLNPKLPRMPPDEPLPEADIQLIQAWIDAGASCD